MIGSGQSQSPLPAVGAQDGATDHCSAPGNTPEPTCGACVTIIIRDFPLRGHHLTKPPLTMTGFTLLLWPGKMGLPVQNRTEPTTPQGIRTFPTTSSSKSLGSETLRKFPSTFGVSTSSFTKRQPTHLAVLLCSYVRRGCGCAGVFTAMGPKRAGGRWCLEST